MSAISYNHDPRDVVRGLQQLLISDSKRIGFLFGAGTSMAVKNHHTGEALIPGIDKMTTEIVNSITDKKFKCAIDEVKLELEEEGRKFQIENILSQVEQKARVIGFGELCGLRKDGLEQLKLLIEENIKEMVSVHNTLELKDLDIIHSRFALWINQVSRKFPIEIFTTNYDYLFEIGLEYQNVPYFDGFIGSYKPFFHPNIIEDESLIPKWTRIWKLHGSLGWELDSCGRKIIKGNRDSGKIMVYPSLTKYDNSKKQPYTSFMDRLSSFIKAEDGVLFICGYSFGDQHINSVILNALEKARQFHVFAFLFDDFNEDSEIVKMAKSQPRLSVYGKRNAVIGTKYGNWKLKSVPSKDDDINISVYFDEDGTEPDASWTGEGDYKLVDYGMFVNFISSFIV